jgi:hypothetical protein
MDFESIARDLIGAYADVRYVAHERAGILKMRVRDGLAEDTTPGASDRYEELLVNPTLVELAVRRGSIESDRLRYVLVAYGKLYQIVIPLEDGHLSVAVEASADPRAIVAALESRLAQPVA